MALSWIAGATEPGLRDAVFALVVLRGLSGDADPVLDEQLAGVTDPDLGEELGVGFAKSPATAPIEGRNRYKVRYRGSRGHGDCPKAGRRGRRGRRDNAFL